MTSVPSKPCTEIGSRGEPSHPKCDRIRPPTICPASMIRVSLPAPIRGIRKAMPKTRQAPKDTCHQQRRTDLAQRFQRARLPTGDADQQSGNGANAPEQRIAHAWVIQCHAHLAIHCQMYRQHNANHEPSAHKREASSLVSLHRLPKMKVHDGPKYWVPRNINCVISEEYTILQKELSTQNCGMFRIVKCDLRCWVCCDVSIGRES